MCSFRKIVFLFITCISAQGQAAHGGDAPARTLEEFLNNPNGFTCIWLENNEIGDEQAIILANALKKNRTVTELNLFKNQIGDTGAIALAEALEVNRTLSSLNLASNKIRVAGAIALAKALAAKNFTERNNTITSLCLDMNPIVPCTASKIATDAIAAINTIVKCLKRNRDLDSAVWPILLSAGRFDPKLSYDIWTEEILPFW